MPVVKSSFKPAWWLRQAHLQTIWPALFRSVSGPQLQSERLELDDGDFLDLAWAGPIEGEIILILHGLEGSRDSSYIKGILSRLSKAGYRCCLMHFRGCSGRPNRLPRSYHSGETGDLQRVVAHLERALQRPVFAVIGYSLGGNVLLKWLGEMKDRATIRTAVAVSVPFSLDDAARRMGSGPSRVYQKHLVKRLQEKYQEKFSRIQSPLNIDVAKLNTFYLFDDQVTAPLHGFRDVHDYYQRSSCGPFLKHIRVPALILHARDDPFMWPETVPKEGDLSSQVCLELSESGGHVGFISGKLPWKPEYWLDQRILVWLQSHSR